MSAHPNTARRVAQRASDDPSSAPASQQAGMDASEDSSRNRITTIWKGVSPRFLLTPSPIAVTDAFIELIDDEECSVTSGATTKEENIVKASKYSLKQLMSMSKRGRIFNSLDFTDYDDNTLAQLFPSNNHAAGGSLPPPLSWRRSASRIREWKRFGQVQQQSLIDVEEKTAADSVLMPAPLPRPASAAVHHDGTTPTSQPTGNNARQRRFPARLLGVCVSLSSASLKRDASSSPERSPFIESPIEPTKLHSVFDASNAMSTVCKPVAELTRTTCCGLTVANLTSDPRTTNASEIKLGFAHLVGEALHNLGTAISQDLSCMLNPHQSLGWLVFKRRNSTPTTSATVSPVKRGQVTFILQLKDDMPLVSKTDPSGYDIAYQFFSFHTPGCIETDKSMGGMCQLCFASMKIFKRKCKDEVNRRENQSIYASVMDMVSPSQLQDAVNKRSLTISALREANARLRQKVTSYLEKEEEIELPLGLMEHHGVESVVELLYDDKIKKMMDEQLTQKGILQHKDLVGYLWEECKLHAERAEQSGKRSCRYSPVLLRWCLSLRNKLGKGPYDFLAQTVNFPSGRTLNDYMSPGRASQDGIIWETLDVFKQQFDNLHGGSAIPRDHWLRMGSLSFDTKSVKEKVETDPHTQRLVGFADDDLQHVDGINAALSSVAMTLSPEDSNDNHMMEADRAPRMARHYGVAYFTSYEYKSKPFQFIAARFAIASLNADYLEDRIDDITDALHRKGFVVIALAGDGASENRLIFSRKANVLVSDVIALGMYPTHWMQKFESLLDFNVGYWHPQLVDKVLIFIHADMPHWVKKFVNALERSGKSKHKTNLFFRDQHMSLDMLKDIWEASISTHSTGLRISKCGADHFDKNAHNRMRFFLAAQITSESICVT